MTVSWDRVVSRGPHRIAKASGSEDLLSCSLVHAGARDGVDYGGDASRKRQKILTTWATPISHTQVGYNSPWSWSDPNRLAVTRSYKTRFFLSIKKISSTRGQSTQHDRYARASSRASEEEEECLCNIPILTHLPSGWTPHLICWSTSLPIFHVKLNLASTFLSLCI
jgi:hypothetical protein